MYEKCLNCEKIGTQCDGPNFIAMSSEDMIKWCSARRKLIPGLTYDRIVEETGLPKSTVSSFFSGTHADYRLETIRPIFKLLVGGDWSDSPCADANASERAAYEEKIRQHEENSRHHKDEIKWRDDKIQHLSKNCESMQTLIANTNARNTKSQEFLQGQIKSKNKTIIALSICLGICLALIIAALIVDRLNGSVGFFWLESLMHRETGNAFKLVSKLIGWSA